MENKYEQLTLEDLLDALEHAIMAALADNVDMETEIAGIRAEITGRFEDILRDRTI